MIEKVQTYLRDLMSSLQAAKLYTTAHPLFSHSVDKAYLSLQEVFKDRDHLVIGIIGEELAFGKEVLFELSKTVLPLIHYLKEKNIEKMVFMRGVSKIELEKFLQILAQPLADTKASAQEQLSYLGVKNITVGKIQAQAQKTEEGHELHELLNVYAAFSKRSSQSLEEVLSGGNLDESNLKLGLKDMLDSLRAEHQEVLILVTVKRYDATTFVHSINVAVLALYFSSHLGFQEQDCLEIAMAGLFHDTGKLRISRKLIKKPGKLTDAEFDIMKSHVIQGAESLLKYSDKIGITPIVASFEHHLKYDLSGYPKITYLKKPHPVSLIITLCDVYDALSQRRGYKNDYPPDAIYEIMVKEKGKSFDPELFDAFFKIFGVWPIGSIVALSDQRIGVVRQENPDDIFSPLVEIIDKIPTGVIVNLKEQKASLKIEKFINPWKEGKQYLSIIQHKQL